MLVDCIEFSESLRRIDTAGEVAFLAMDLAYRGRGELAARFLRRYAERADDFGLFAVVDLYAAYRAAVRAKVAGLAARDAAIAERQRHAAAESAARHLALAERLLAPRRAPAPVIALCGTVGSGKTTVAERLAERLEGAVDLLGPDAQAPRGTRPRRARGRGARRRALHRRVDRAHATPRSSSGPSPSPASGRAAAPRRDLRGERAAARRARASREALGAAAWLVEVRCGEATALERLAPARAGGPRPLGRGPRAAGAERAPFEPPEEWPRERHLVVESDGPDVDAQLDGGRAAVAGGR